MSKIVYSQCDWCGRETRIQQADDMLTIQNKNPNLPFGDFCSITCCIRYLEDWIKYSKSSALDDLDDEEFT